MTFLHKNVSSKFKNLGYIIIKGGTKNDEDKTSCFLGWNDSVDCRFVNILFRNTIIFHNARDNFACGLSDIANCKLFHKRKIKKIEQNILKTLRSYLDDD